MTTTTAVAEMERRLIEVERTLGFNPTPNGQGVREKGQIWNDVGASKIEIHVWAGSFASGDLTLMHTIATRLCDKIRELGVDCRYEFHPTGLPDTVPPYYRQYPVLALMWDEVIRLIDIVSDVRAADTVTSEIVALTRIRDRARQALRADDEANRHVYQKDRITHLRAALAAILADTTEALGEAQ